MKDMEIEKIIQPYLWGVDIESLDIDKDRFLIIERLLEHGGDRQVKFVQDKFTREDMVQVIQESSYLSRKTVNYWCLVLNLEKEETRCYKKKFQHLWPPS